MWVGLGLIQMDQNTVRMEMECVRNSCKVPIRVHIRVHIRVNSPCLTPGMLIRTYSYYFLTQFGSFLFVRVKY